MISLPNDIILQEYFSMQLNLIKIVDNGFPETSIQSKINDTFKLCTLDDEGIFFFNSVSLTNSFSFIMAILPFFAYQKVSNMFYPLHLLFLA